MHKNKKNKSTTASIFLFIHSSRLSSQQHMCNIYIPVFICLLSLSLSLSLSRSEKSSRQVGSSLAAAFRFLPRDRRVEPRLESLAPFLPLHDPERAEQAVYRAPICCSHLANSVNVVPGLYDHDDDHDHDHAEPVRRWAQEARASEPRFGRWWHTSRHVRVHDRQAAVIALRPVQASHSGGMLAAFPERSRPKQSEARRGEGKPGLSFFLSFFLSLSLSLSLSFHFFLSFLSLDRRSTKVDFVSNELSTAYKTRQTEYKKAEQAVKAISRPPPPPPSSEAKQSQRRDGFALRSSPPPPSAVQPLKAGVVIRRGERKRPQKPRLASLSLSLVSGWSIPAEAPKESLPGSHSLIPGGGPTRRRTCGLLPHNTEEKNKKKKRSAATGDSRL